MCTKIIQIKAKSKVKIQNGLELGEGPLAVLTGDRGLGLNGELSQAPVHSPILLLRERRSARAVTAVMGPVKFGYDPMSLKRRLMA